MPLHQKNSTPRYASGFSRFNAAGNSQIEDATDYVRMVKDPVGQKPVHAPIMDPRPCTVKKVTMNATLSNLQRDVLFRWVPYSDRPGNLIVYGLQTGVGFVPAARLQYDTDITASFTQFRPLAGSLTFKSSTLPSGAFALNGLLHSAMFSAPPEVLALTLADISGKAAEDKSNVVLAMEAVRGVSNTMMPEDFDWRDAPSDVLQTSEGVNLLRYPAGSTAWFKAAVAAGSPLFSIGRIPIQGTIPAGSAYPKVPVGTLRITGSMTHTPSATGNYTITARLLGRRWNPTTDAFSDVTVEQDIQFITVAAGTRFRTDVNVILSLPDDLEVHQVIFATPAGNPGTLTWFDGYINVEWMNQLDDGLKFASYFTYVQDVRNQTLTIQGAMVYDAIPIDTLANLIKLDRVMYADPVLEMTQLYLLKQGYDFWVRPANVPLALPESSEEVMHAGGWGDLVRALLPLAGPAAAAIHPAAGAIVGSLAPAVAQMFSMGHTTAPEPRVLAGSLWPHGPLTLADTFVRAASNEIPDQVLIEYEQAKNPVVLREKIQTTNGDSAKFWARMSSMSAIDVNHKARSFRFINSGESVDAYLSEHQLVILYMCAIAEAFGPQVVVLGHEVTANGSSYCIGPASLAALATPWHNGFARVTTGSVYVDFLTRIIRREPYYCPMTVGSAFKEPDGHNVLWALGGAESEADGLNFVPDVDAYGGDATTIEWEACSRASRERMSLFTNFMQTLDPSGLRGWGVMHFPVISADLSTAKMVRIAWAPSADGRYVVHNPAVKLELKLPKGETVLLSSTQPLGKTFIKSVYRAAESVGAPGSLMVWNDDIVDGSSVGMAAYAAMIGYDGTKSAATGFVYDDVHTVPSNALEVKKSICSEQGITLFYGYPEFVSPIGITDALGHQAVPNLASYILRLNARIGLDLGVTRKRQVAEVVTKVVNGKELDVIEVRNESDISLDSPVFPGSGLGDATVREVLKFYRGLPKMIWRGRTLGDIPPGTKNPVTIDVLKETLSTFNKRRANPAVALNYASKTMANTILRLINQQNAADNASKAVPPSSKQKARAVGRKRAGLLGELDDLFGDDEPERPGPAGDPDYDALDEF